MAAPKIFRNLWLAVFLFILIIWLEYTIALTDQARLIAYLALCIFAVTFVSGLFFAGKSFCRYGCPVGAICGLYGFFAPLELRSSDKNTCRECRTKDCIKGNQNGGPCPVFEYPGAMDDNLYCIFCVECISACPNDNISVNARKPAVDLLKFKALSFSEMFMVVTMLALSVFGAINISSVHLRIIEWASVKLHLPEAASLLLLMLALMAGFLLVIYALAGLYRTGPSPVSYVLLPVALFNHMANTVKLFSIRAEEAIPLVSDPFGLSWNLFGTAGHLSKPFFAPETLSIIIAPLMLIGLIYSIYLLMSLRKSHAFSLPSAVYGLLVVFGLVWLNWWLIPQ